MSATLPSPATSAGTGATPGTAPATSAAPATGAAPAPATAPSTATAPPPGTRLPRLGFLGTGWIGCDRLRAVQAAGAAEVVAVADPDDAGAERALALAPAAARAGSLEELLELGLDGIAIATPSAMHAAQARAALDAGVAVFCQKPLARTARETAVVIEAARRRDLLLGVDLSYRRTAAAEAVRAQVRSGAIGPVHEVELVFHNAYGPDKPWFLDPELSGGGCLIDLGTHLVDLLLWTLDFPPVVEVSGRRWREGRPAGAREAEDMCVATLDLAGGAVARLACSWFSHEGADAVIEATFRGRDGAASMRNVGGSFYDLLAERREGTAATELVAPPDAWPGRTAVDWARALASGARYEESCERLLLLAETIDSIYGR